PVWGTVADVTVQDEEGGSALGLPEDLQGALNAIDVVGVSHPQDVPSVTQEAGRNVFRERDARVPLDGDVIVVVDPAEVIQAQVTRQGRGLGGDALHHAAVAANRIDMVVENIEARPVVALGEPLLTDGHAHAGSHSLPERTAGSLDAGNPVILRVPRGLAIRLTEMPDVGEPYRRVPQPF